MFRAIFFCFVVFIGFLTLIEADCDLFLGPETPILIKEFGSNKFILPKNIDIVKLINGETISAYCSSGFEIEGYNSYNLETENLHFYCEENVLKSDEYNFSHGQSYSVRCKWETKFDLYESQVHQLANCEQYTSIVLGFKSDNFKMLAMCYDFEKSQAKFITYLAYNPRNIITNKWYRTDLDKLQFDISLNSVEEYMQLITPTDVANALDVKSTEPLYFRDKFEYSTLLQDPRLLNDTALYAKMFMIFWSSDLRNGSWKYFLSAFEERAEIVKYQVRLGTSGVVKYPTDDNCHSYKQLNFKINDKMIDVPHYIWTHISSVDRNGTELVPKEDFVIIGINTPFVNVTAEISPHCSDMCNEISWLNNSIFGKLRLMPAYGIVVCCRAEEAASFLQLLGTNTISSDSTTSTSLYEGSGLDNNSF